MRLLFGVLTLLALFAAAALWQRSWTTEARSDRAPFPGAGGATAAGSGDGWSRVVVGRPSGGEPYANGPESAPAPRAPGVLDTGVHAQPAPAPPAPDAAPPPTEPAADAVVDVQAGQTLSEICRIRYGTARPALVLAVARYNHLAGPDEIKEGQRIRLPEAGKLAEKD